MPIVVEAVSVESFITFAKLSWSILADYYTYEVGISEAGQSCSSKSTFPQNYKSYDNVSTGTIKVSDLMADSCYVFDVRAYSMRINEPGEWTVAVSSTLRLPEGIILCSNRLLF